MKIRKRQNRLYELFNGRNRVRYIAVSVAYIYVLIIFVTYNIFYQWSYDLNNTIFILLCIIFMRVLLKKFFKRFYYARFNPAVYYEFAQIKFNNRKKFKIGKHKSKDLKLNKAIIATKKYIDRHYNHYYDADVLLSRLESVKSKYDTFSQLPPNFIIGVVTGVISGRLSTVVLTDVTSVIANIACSTIALLFLYFAIKSFYSEYESIIIPYEIKIIKHKLSNIDDIYSI